MEWEREEFVVTTDRNRFDVSTIHQYLNEVAYWSKGVSRATVEKAIENSLAFGLFANGAQVGFARLITDHATFAYLSDVFVLPAYQGKGLGTWFMGCVFQHPDLFSMRRIMLITKDAQLLYEKFGFSLVADPATVMEKLPGKP